MMRADKKWRTKVFYYYWSISITMGIQRRVHHAEKNKLQFFPLFFVVFRFSSHKISDFVKSRLKFFDPLCDLLNLCLWNQMLMFIVDEKRRKRDWPRRRTALMCLKIRILHWKKMPQIKQCMQEIMCHTADERHDNTSRSKDLFCLIQKMLNFVKISWRCCSKSPSNQWHHHTW